MIHILNEEPEAQGDKVNCPNPKADPGVQKAMCFPVRLDTSQASSRPAAETR